MNSNKFTVSKTEEVSQISQNAQASQIRYFKMAVDTLFLCMENNLEDEDKDNMFKDEDDIDEKTKRVAQYYDNLLVSDEKKSELRQYILKGADEFNSKYEEVYGETYMDNYFDFITHADFDDFKAGKENENADQYKVKKCKEVVIDDSDSESDDESVSMFSETQSENESEDDSEGDIESERDFLEKENEDNVHFINNLKKEIESLKKIIEDDKIIKKGMIQKSEENKQEYEKKIYELKHGKPCKCCNQKMKECKCCVVEYGNEYTCTDCNHIESDCRCCVDYYVNEIRELRKTNEKEQLIRTEMAEKLEETNNNERNWMVYAINRDEQIKNLKAVIDDLRTQKDENIEQIRQQNEDFDKMKKSRDHFEWLNKKRQENEIFLINQQNKTQDENALKFIERDDKIKELKKTLEETKKMHSEVAEELKESEHHHSVDAKELFKQIIRNGKLKKQIRLLKLLIK